MCVSRIAQRKIGKGKIHQPYIVDEVKFTICKKDKSSRTISLFFLLRLFKSTNFSLLFIDLAVLFMLGGANFRCRILLALHLHASAITKEDSERQSQTYWFRLWWPQGHSPDWKRRTTAGMGVFIQMLTGNLDYLY